MLNYATTYKLQDGPQSIYGMDFFSILTLEKFWHLDYFTLCNTAATLSEWWSRHLARTSYAAVTK